MSLVKTIFRFKVLLLSLFTFYCSCHPHSDQKFTTENPLPENILLALQRFNTALYTNDTPFLDTCFIMPLKWRMDTLYFYEQDTMLWVARKHGDKWSLLDHVNGHGLFHIDTMDINADGNTDILIEGHPQMNGYTSTLPILSRQDGSIQVRTDAILWNFAYIRERNIVRSYWEGSWYTTKFKEEYHWVNDSLQLLAGVRLIPANTLMDDTSNMTILEYYHIQGDSEIITKRISGDSNDAAYWSALWDGYGAPE